MRISKDQGVTGIVASVVAIMPLLGVVWFVVKPALRDSIGVAMADEIKDTVQKELAPVKAGFDVLLADRIVSIQKEIALLERRGATNLSAEETTHLVDLRAQLQAQQRALEALRK